MQRVSFCCARKDKSAQVTQFFAAGSTLVLVAVLQTLQKSPVSFSSVQIVIYRVPTTTLKYESNRE